MEAPKVLPDGTGATATMGAAAQGKIQDINQRAHDAVDKATGAVSNTVERVTGFPERMENLACDYVKAKPIQSVAVGFMAGFLLGKLMR